MLRRVQAASFVQAPSGVEFVQFGGIMLIVSLGQVTLATVLMVIYSPVLAAVTWGCFIPLVIAVRSMQKSLGAAYSAVRERIGDVLAAVSESVVGAATIRSRFSVPSCCSRRCVYAMAAS